MELLVLRLVSLVGIALAYMLFDLFNKRNIPTLFVYAGLAYGALLTALYLSYYQIAISAGVAAAILGIGYIVYRNGYLGAGDVFELATLSLIFPFQAVPLLISTAQLGLPFIVSIFIGSGVAALVAVPLYYMPRAKVSGMKIGNEIERGALAKAVSVGLAYAVFAAFLSFEIGIGVAGIALIAIMMVGSIAVILFEKPMASSMVEYVDYTKMEEGDMIAINLMDKSEVERIRKRANAFDRLVTRRLIGQLRSKRIRSKVPVYKNAIPMAAPIFVGVIASILFGNVILLLLIVH